MLLLIVFVAGGNPLGCHVVPVAEMRKPSREAQPLAKAANVRRMVVTESPPPRGGLSLKRWVLSSVTWRTPESWSVWASALA